MAKSAIKFLSARFKMEPTLFIAGFQKCGTTSLYNYLLETETYLGGKVKENNYLDNVIFRSERVRDPRSWPEIWLNDPKTQVTDLLGALAGHPFANVTLSNYLAQSAVFHKCVYLWTFPWKRPRKITLDASHQNTYYPHGLQRIRDHFPDSKVIFIMRNPADRAYSHYQHTVRFGAYPFSFSHRLNEEFAIINTMNDVNDTAEVYAKTVDINAYGLPVTRGLYVNYIRIAQELGLDFLPVCLEKLSSDFESCWERIEDFLGIRSGQVPQQRVHNPAPPYPEMLSNDRERLQEFYKEYNEQLFSLVGESYPW